MTVGELISKLEEYGDHLEVVAILDEDGQTAEIKGISDNAGVVSVLLVDEDDV